MLSEAEIKNKYQWSYIIELAAFCFILIFIWRVYHRILFRNEGFFPIVNLGFLFWGLGKGFNPKVTRWIAPIWRVVIIAFLILIMLFSIYDFFILNYDASHPISLSLHNMLLWIGVMLFGFWFGWRETNKLDRYYSELEIVKKDIL